MQQSKPGVVPHFDNGRDAAPFLADELRVGAVKFHLARCVRAIAELVLQAQDLDRRCAHHPASIAASRNSSNPSAIAREPEKHRTSAPT